MNGKGLAEIDEFNKFYNELTEFIDEQNQNNQEIPEKYLSLKEELDEIKMIAAENEVDAMERYHELECSKYEGDLKKYRTNTESKFMKSTKFTMETTKVMRSKRAIIKCPNCNKPLSYFADGSYGCSICNYEAPKAYNTPNTKININNTKHITKQLDAICGQKKIPISISKIIQYISIWLTDLHYLHEWLVYDNSVERFSDLYHQITKQNIPKNWFDQVLERTPENQWNFKLYKLLLDEFFKMTELCKRILVKGISSLNTRPVEEKLHAIELWLNSIDLTKDNINNIAMQNNQKSISSKQEFVKVIEQIIIPPINALITDPDNGINYDIGLYFANISLRPSLRGDEFYEKIVQLFNDKLIEFEINPDEIDIGNKLIIGGLMFDYDKVYKINESIPKKYNYGQEYFVICNHVFNTPFTDITNKDKDILVQILTDFNNYYKHTVMKPGNSKNNSPLFGCTLIAIIKSLNYFSKYKPILQKLPEKYETSATMNTILTNWNLYLMSNPEIYNKYNKRSEEFFDEDEDLDII